MGRNEDARGTPTVKERILGVLGHEWMTEMEVASLIAPLGTYNSINRELRQLVIEGEAESVRTNLGGSRLVYRKAGPGPAPPVPRYSLSEEIMETVGAEWMTAGEIASALKRDVYVTRRNLNKLYQEGAVERHQTVLRRRVAIYRKAGYGPAPYPFIDTKFEATRAAFLKAIGSGWMPTKAVIGFKPDDVSVSYALNVLKKMAANGEVEKGKARMDGHKTNIYAPSGSDPPSEHKAITESILAVVGSEWMTSKDVEQACPDVSHSSMRSTLDRMVIQGKLDRASTDKVTAYRLAGSVSRVALPLYWSQRESVLVAIGSRWRTAAEVTSAIDPAGTYTSSKYNVDRILKQLVCEGLAKTEKQGNAPMRYKIAKVSGKEAEA